MEALPILPALSNFLCNCWYTSEKIINIFAQKRGRTTDALKTNRLLYPSEIKKISELAADVTGTLYLYLFQYSKSYTDFEVFMKLAE